MPAGTWASFVRRVPLAFVLIGAGGIGLAFFGECVPRGWSCFGSPKELATAIWRSAALVVFQAAPNPLDSWHVVTGRLMAPFLTGGAVLIGLNWWLADLWVAGRIRMWSDHTVVFGSGPTARRFGQSLAGSVAFVGPEALDVLRPAGAGPTIRLQSNVPVLIERLAAADFGVTKASRMLIATGSDADNLAVLQAVQALRRTNVAATEHAVEVAIEISNPLLWRELNARDGFGVRHAASGGLEVMPFHADNLAARRFLEDHPLVDLALLRAQQRIRLVVMGLSPFVLECLEGIARLNPSPRLATPEIDLFVCDTAGAARQLRSIQPAFSIADSPGEATDDHAPLSIRLHTVDDVTRIPTDNQLLSLDESRARVTAVIVTADDEQGAAAMAMTLRDRCQAAGVCRGPVFVRIGSRTAVRRGLAEASVDPDPGKRIVPVGEDTEVYHWRWLFGPREDAAKQLHAAYDSSGRMPWEQLPQGLRNANRRVVDQIPVKLMVAGFMVGQRPLRLPSLTAVGIHLADPTDHTIETLAAVEHASWDTERRLAGWRPGIHRDDRRRIHPMVGRSFDEIRDARIKELDRAQVRTALQMVATREGAITVRRELRVGVLGRLRLSPEEKQAAAEFASQTVRRLVEQTDFFVSVLSPLAPGGDMVMSRAVMMTLASLGCQHRRRLVHVRSVPTSAVISRFRQDYPEHAAEVTEDALAHFLSESPAVVADLEFPGIGGDRWHTDLVLQQQAFQRANAYLVSVCHHLIVFGGSNSDGSQPPPGGTREALMWVAAGVPAHVRMHHAMLHAGPPQVHRTDTHGFH